MRIIAFMLVAMVAFGSTRTLADEAAYKVIVNPKNGAGRVSREFLRSAWLKKELAWGDGSTIRPIDLTTKFPVRDRFTRLVVKKTPAQLKSYWSQQIFSGKGVPPPEATSAADIVTYVLAHPGAVGYVPAETDSRGAKVIEVQ